MEEAAAAASAVEAVEAGLAEEAAEADLAEEAAVASAEAITDIITITDKDKDLSGASDDVPITAEGGASEDFSAY